MICVIEKIKSFFYVTFESRSGHSIEHSKRFNYVDAAREYAKWRGQELADKFQTVVSVVDYTK